MSFCSEIITFCAFFLPVLLHPFCKIVIIGYEVTPMQLEEILRSMCNDIELITGIKTVILPADNMRDLDEIDTEARENLNFIPCKTATEVLKFALVKD